MFCGCFSFLSMNCFSTNVQASEIEKYDNSDILNIIQTKNDTQIFMPDNTIIVLKDFTEKFQKKIFNSQLKQSLF